MGIKVYKPTTNGRRNMTSLDFAEITTSTPEKSLLVSLKNKAGRNNNGRNHCTSPRWRAQTSLPFD